LFFIVLLVGLMSTPTYQDRELALVELYHTMGIIPLTFVYGVYSCLVPVFVFVMLTKGLRTRIRKLLFFMSLFMYIMCTTHWCLSVANTIMVYKNDFVSPTSVEVSLYLTLFTTIILVNYFLTDGVVVWRAWVLCSDRSRWLLKIPIALQCCLAVSITITIGFRIRLSVSPISPDLLALMTSAMNISQTANLVFSLLTNISATTIISMKAWKFRRDITQEFARTQTSGNRIMAMIVESGILYCFSGLTVLMATVIKLEHGTLGDIYTPVNFQIAGIYPIVVILLVNQGTSMDKTVFMSTIPHHSSSAHNHQGSRLETMCFDIPVDSSRRSSSETASYMDDNSNDMHTTFADKSLPGIPLSPSGLVMDIKASK